jgi:hypothetical protein
VGKKDEQPGVPPRELPSVQPDHYRHAIDSTFMVESMMEVQKTLGELHAEVRNLKAASDEQTRKLDRISHIVFAAGAIVALLLTIGGFLINKVWDGVADVLARLPPVA